MKRLHSLALVLALFALLTLPAFAHPAQQSDEVIKTFQLTIYGDVPPGTAFSVTYGSLDNFAQRVFCGPVEGIVVPTPTCTGNGAVYTVVTDKPRGDTLNFRYQIHRGGELTGTTFYEGTETLNSDMTNTAYYTFETTAPGNDQQDMPSQLPDTGLPGLPLGGLAGSVALLAGGLVLRKRR
jgi:LPXTG-motif cell wall-anchored protein